MTHRPRKGRFFNQRDCASRITQETQTMFNKLISGIAGAAFMLAVGLTTMTQSAQAAPWCYKTGPNTVQCTR